MEIYDSIHSQFKLNNELYTPVLEDIKGANK